MYNKVIYIVKSELHYYPPCVSQVRLLKELGVNIEVWFGSSNKSALKIFDNEKICYKCIGREKIGFGLFGKAVNWYVFRKSIQRLMRNMSKDEKSQTLFWFGTTESVLPLMRALKGINYLLTSLELLDDKSNDIKRILFGKVAKQAKAIVACEETRAYIMKYWYNLEALPYVMPNKPYSLGVDKKAEPTCDLTREALEKVVGKKFIIYQGIFQNIDYLCEIARALKELNTDYYLVMMGFDIRNRNTIEELKKIYDKVIYIESLPAPLHLEITSHAHIGVVFYDGNTLNKAFCAPNKIYEYSGFGIPALANRIPGLTNTIHKSGAGKCVELVSDQIAKAIKDIEREYEFYSKSAIDFYNNTNNMLTMKSIVNNQKIISSKGFVKNEYSS